MIITRNISREDASLNRNSVKSFLPDFEKKKEEYHYTYGNTWIFLSHKHRENEILIDVISILKQHGGYIYIDWMDDSLPTSTSGATAQKLKSKNSVISNKT